MPQPFDPNDPNAQPDLNYEPPAPPPEVQGTGISTPTQDTSYPSAPAPTGTGPTDFYADAAERERLINEKGTQDQAVEAQKAEASQREADIAGQFATEQDKRIHDMEKLSEESRRLRNINNNNLMQHAMALQSDKYNIDPEHWWNSRDTGGKVSAVIGLILGGVGQGFQMWGGNKQAHNAALDELDNIIKSDIDSQDHNLKNKWEAYREMHNLADNAENYRHWEMMTKQKEFDLAHSVFDAQLKQAAAQSGSESAKLNANQAIIDHDKAMADERRAMGVHGEQLSAQSAALVEKRRQEQRAEDKAAADEAQALKATGLSDADIETRVQNDHPTVTFSYDAKVNHTATALQKTKNPATGQPFTKEEARAYVEAHPQAFNITKPSATPSATTATQAEATKAAHEDYVKVVKDYDETLALIDQLGDRRLSDDDKKELAKHGIVVGSPVFSGDSIDPAKARAAARAKKDADLKALEPPATTSNSPSPQYKTVTGQGKVITTGKDLPPQ